MRGKLVFSLTRFAAVLFLGAGTAHGATMTIGGHIYEGATVGKFCAGGVNDGAACALNLDCLNEIGVCDVAFHCDIGGTNLCVDGPRIGEGCMSDEECGGTCHNWFRFGAPCLTAFECDVLGTCAQVPVFGGTPITGATVMVQNQHSGGAWIANGTVVGNAWSAVVPDDGDYVIMFAAPGHDLTSREVTITAGAVKHPIYTAAPVVLAPIGANFSTTANDIDAYLPTTPLGTANLLVYAFYDFLVNGDPDGFTGEDEALNGVTFTVRDEDSGLVVATGVTGTQTIGGGPPNTITLPPGCGTLPMANTGMYYFTGLPSGKMVVTSDASTVTAAANTFVRPLAFSEPDDALREWYLDYTEEGGHAWDVPLAPGDCGSEGGTFLIWHGYVEKIGSSAGYTGVDKRTISGFLIDADGNDPAEPFPVPGPPGVTMNTNVPDGLVILFTAGEAVKTHPVATAEPSGACFGESSPPFTTCTTDAECAPHRCGQRYVFTDVEPGQYKIMAVDVPLDHVWQQVQVDVTGGDVICDGNPLTLCPADPWIARFFGRGQGFVYHDGVPAAGATVNLRYKSGSIEQTTTTDATGWYNFDDMPEIEVMGYIDVELPAGYRGQMKTDVFDFWVGRCGVAGPTPAGNLCKIGPLVDPTIKAASCPVGETCWADTTTVTHNAMNRYVMWLTANYRADLYLESIPGTTGDIRGYVWGENLPRGSWIPDGLYDADKERTLHGVTVELWDAANTTLLATTTSGKVDDAALMAQGVPVPYTMPANEFGGVFAGPMIGFYEFRDLAAGSYTVRVTGPPGFSASPASSDVAMVVVAGGSGTEHNVGFATLTPQAGEIEGGVFDDLNIDTNQNSTLFMEKAGIAGAPVGAYDHNGYLMGTGYMGNPFCHADAVTCGSGGICDGDEFTPRTPCTSDLNCVGVGTGTCNLDFCCPPGEPTAQKPEMERRFAPSVHTYFGNDPAFPGHTSAFEALVLPYTFSQGQFRFEADWSLPPLAATAIETAVIVEPVVLQTASGLDVAVGAPPASDASVDEGLPFVVELWAQQVAPVTPPHPLGLTSVYADLTIAGNAGITCTGTVSAPNFSLTPGGACINPGGVDDVGGALTLPAPPPQGIPPEWVRIASVNMMADAAGGGNTIQAGPTLSALRTAVTDLGQVPDQLIEFRSTSSFCVLGCAGKQCGGDGCGGTCGTCADSCEHCGIGLGTCDWCVLDLNYNGVMDGLDFAFFSGCFGSCYPPGDPCLVSNFDGDPNGCVGGGDFGGFAGCFSLDCAGCANCAGPGAMARTASAMVQREFEASVRLVAVAEPTAYDHADALPASTEIYGLREAFFVEVWASRADAAKTSEQGLAAAYVDLTYDPLIMEVQSITPGETFGLFAGGFVDDAAGLIGVLGGCAQLGVTTAGVESAWVRVATVEMRVIAAGKTKLASGPSGEPFGISLIDRFGNLDASRIDFGQTQLTLGSAPAGPPRRLRKRSMNSPSR